MCWNCLTVVQMNDIGIVGGIRDLGLDMLNKKPAKMEIGG